MDQGASSLLLLTHKSVPAALPPHSALLNLNLSGKPPRSDPQHPTPSPHCNRDRVKGGVTCAGYERWNACVERRCWRKAGGLISLVGGESVGWMQGGGKKGQTALWTQSDGGVKRGGRTDRSLTYLRQRPQQLSVELLWATENGASLCHYFIPTAEESDVACGK